MIHNAPKWTISASDGLELLQMVLEPVTRQCASKDAGPKEGGLCDPRSVGEKIKHFL